MKSWVCGFAAMGVAGALGTTVWAQSADTGFDFGQLKQSLNIHGYDDGPIFGFMPTDLGLDGSELPDLPPLVLAEDGNTALWQLDLMTVLGQSGDIERLLPLDIVFEQLDDNRYRFYGDSQASLAFLTSDNDVNIAPDQMFDFSVEGIWHAGLQTVGQIAMDLGGVEFTTSDTAISFGGFDLFAGAWSDYKGDVQPDFSGLEPSTAEVMIGEIAPITAQHNGRFDSFNVEWQGFLMEAVQAMPEGSDRPVANILYGSPEILAASRQFSQALAFISAVGVGGDVEVLPLLAEPLTSIFATVPDHIDTGISMTLSVLPLSLEWSQFGDVSSVDLDGIKVTSVKQPGSPANSKFTIDVSPVQVDGNGARFGFDRLVAFAELSDFDAVAFSDRARALLMPDGSWGDLTGVILAALPGFNEEIYVEGFQVSGLDAFMDTGGADLSGPSQDDANAEIHMDKAWVRIALDDITALSGATLSYEYGLEGLDLPWDIAAGDSVIADYLTPSEDNLRELVPTDGNIQVQVANIPLAKWQAQLEMLPRRSSILDIEGLASELNLLTAAGFQFLALIAADPLVVTVDAAVGNELVGVDAQARYLLDFVTPETLGVGEGMVTVRRGDFLLQRLMKVHKSVALALRDPENVPDLAAFDFFDELTIARRQLSEARALAEVTEQGDWQFFVSIDPEIGALVNGLPMDSFLMFLEN